MALRNRLPEAATQYADPVYGCDLRSAWDDVQPGFARQLKNLVYDGGLVSRKGSTRLTPSTLGAYKGRGGCRYYYGTNSAKRLIAYNTKISVIDDSGVESVLTSGMTADLDTFFRTWGIDGKLYISNGTDALRSYDGTSFATVTGTNIPTGKMVTPFLDRLFCIQGAGVVTTNPRVANVWSPTTSSWSFYQPFTGGNPTALHVHTATGTNSSPLGQLLIFTPNSVTALTGTNFDADVTAGTPTANWDAELTLIEARYGTQSPYSVTSVPGMGTFWFTSDFRIAWLPWGQTNARIISDYIWSNQPAINGTNKVNAAALSQVVMTYHDRKLKLFMPVLNNTYPTVQWWLDIRLLDQFPNRGFHWNGPHTGQSVGRTWVEDQNGDTGNLYGLEGNSTTGLFVYALDQPNVYTDAIGTSDVAFAREYDTYYHDFGFPRHEKYIPRIQVGVQGNPNAATVVLRDLHGSNNVSSLAITDMNGSSFTANSKWGTSTKWGDGRKWGNSTGAQMGEVWPDAQGIAPLRGDRMSVEITHTGGFFGIDSIIPEVQVRPSTRVS